jgi:hypothetical protein
LGKEEGTDEVIEKSTDFRSWHFSDMTLASANVRSSG